MNTLIFALFCLALNASAGTLSVSEKLLATDQPQNCVNPGGGCDGTVPCCASNVNACVRGRCQPVPRLNLKTEFQTEFICLAGERN